MTGIPVCAGQSEIGRAGCRDLMMAGAIDVCNFDASWGAGPTDPFLGDLGGNFGNDFGSGGGFGGLGGNEPHEFLSGGGFGAPPPSPDFGSPPPPIASFGFSEPMGQAYVPRPIMADPDPFAGSVGIPEDWASPGNGVGDGLPIPEFEPFPAAPPVGPAPFGEAPAADPFAAPAQPDPLPDFGGDGASPFPPASPPPPASSAAGGADWAAFYEGAGFTPEDLKLPPDAMYRLGVLYRQVVLGLCDILQDRATFKDEFRVERTQLSMGRNNPLKHLPAFDAAKVVIGQPLPGFMDGEEAVRTSFEDIKKHQMAMLAGVQNALTTAFSRLSPQEMEKLVEKAQGEKKGFLGKRGIDRWSLYVTVYENLRRDATSNANGIMSSAFREGYEKFMKSAR